MIFIYDKIYNFFLKFGSEIKKIEVEQEHIDIHDFSMGRQLMYSSNRINILIEGSQQGLEEMANYLEKIEENEKEIELRKSNLTLQKAYEEYQILLNIIK